MWFDDETMEKIIIRLNVYFDRGNLQIMAPAISSWRFLCWRLRIFTIKTHIQMNFFFLSSVQHRSTDPCSSMLPDYRQKYSFKYVFWSWKLANRGAGLRHVAGCGILLIYSRSKYTFKRPFFSYHRFSIDPRKSYNATNLAFNQLTGKSSDFVPYFSNLSMYREIVAAIEITLTRSSLCTEIDEGSPMIPELPHQGAERSGSRPRPIIARWDDAASI